MLPAVSPVSCLGSKSVKKFCGEEAFPISGGESFFACKNGSPEKLPSNRLSAAVTAAGRTVLLFD